MTFFCIMLFLVFFTQNGWHSSFYGQLILRPRKITWGVNTTHTLYIRKHIDSLALLFIIIKTCQNWQISLH